MEDKPPTFEQIREDVEARQKSILWEDQFRNNRAVTTFLWHGDPKAKPVQRAGLVVFGVQFLLLSSSFVEIWRKGDPDDRSLIPLFLAAIWLAISLRLLRNACLRRTATVQTAEDPEKADEPKGSA